MGFTPLTSQLNDSDREELSRSLELLINTMDNYFANRGADVRAAIVGELQGRDAAFPFWFAFLRGIFLRGRDDIANKAFLQFMSYCKGLKCDYYYNHLPEGPFLPQFHNPKYRYANAVEEVLSQVKTKYGSGKAFTAYIEGLLEKVDRESIHEGYLLIMRELLGFKQIASKIANAVLGELSWHMSLMSAHYSHKVEEFLSVPPRRRLLLTSLFNTMIDSHVKRFFKEKLRVEYADVIYTYLIFLSRSVDRDILLILLKKFYPWIGVVERLEGQVFSIDQFLDTYRDYVGANVLEKLIWAACFTRRNIVKDNDEFPLFQLLPIFTQSSSHTPRR